MMNETLSNITKILDGISPPAPKTVQMTQDEFIAYAKAEVVKIGEEKDEEKAKKRLEVLVKNVEALKKASWEGTNGQSITLYEEPNLTAKTEESDQTITPPMGSGTQGAQSFAASEGAQSFAKALEAIESEVKKAQVAKAATPPPVWPRDLNSRSFMKEGVAKRNENEDEDWGADPA